MFRAAIFGSRPCRLGTPQRLTTDGHDSGPRWSPSGQWLAFRKERQVMVEQECDIPKPRPQICLESVPVLQRQVWVVEADGNSMHLLGQGASIDAFAWSPVDDRLAYSIAKSGLSTSLLTALIWSHWFLKPLMIAKVREVWATLSGTLLGP